MLNQTKFCEMATVAVITFNTDILLALRGQNRSSNWGNNDRKKGQEQDRPSWKNRARATVEERGVNTLRLDTRGFAGQSLWRVYSMQGIRGQSKHKAIKLGTEAAEFSWRWVWIKREEPSDTVHPTTNWGLTNPGWGHRNKTFWILKYLSTWKTKSTDDVANCARRCILKVHSAWLKFSDPSLLFEPH